MKELLAIGEKIEPDRTKNGGEWVKRNLSR